MDQDGKDAPAVNQALAAMKEAVYGMNIDRRVTTLEVRSRASLEGKGKAGGRFRVVRDYPPVHPGAGLHYASSDARMAQHQDCAHLPLF